MSERIQIEILSHEIDGQVGMSARVCGTKPWVWSGPGGTREEAIAAMAHHYRIQAVQAYDTARAIESGDYDT